MIIGSILFIAAVGGGLGALKMNNDGRIFFSKENPQLQALEELENTYTKNENILFALAPKDGDVFTRETLAAIEKLTEASWQIPFSNRVDSITNYQHTVAEGDDLIVEDLVTDAMRLSDEELTYKKEIALREPLLVNRIISETGHVTGVNVNILKPGKEGNESPVATAFAREMVEEFTAEYPNIDVYLSGSVLMDTAFGEAGASDAATLLPIMFGIIFILLGLLLRSFSGVFATLMVLVLSVITGMGFAGLIGIDLTPASSNAPVIILTLAVADSIHLLVTLFHEMRNGRSKHEAIIESVRVNLQPVFLTSITTAIGFLSMNFSDAPPFRDLGNIVAVGVMAALVFSVIFLPAMMAVLPVSVRPKPKEGWHMTNMADGLGEFVVKKQNQLFVGMIALMVVISSGLAFIELDDNFVRYFDTRYTFRQASDFIIENLSGMDVIEYSLKSGQTNGINNPEYLNKVEAFANWYRAQPNVANVQVITDIYKRLNKNMHGDDPAFYRIPDDQELAAQYMLLYEMSLPYGLDLNNQINIDKSSTRMVVTLKETTARQLREMDDKARAWLAQNAAAMRTWGAGLSVMWANISKRNIDSMLSGSFLALALISGILMVVLRSLKLGAVSLIPNLAPAFMAFGVWGFIEGRVGLAVSVLVALTLGIVVDDTVHFMSKYLRARREHGMDAPDAVRYSFHTVGVALTVSTIVLVAGFTVLSFSGFKVNSDMGTMTAITISLALLLDFLFLPTLLMKLEGNKQ